ncbi:ARM repeat-containing protein [Viridothelium virens]|uniref:ARM repeat-containing protein n=1 Tax=Viridothelium virens TaxID=1048519 RepID=A0A6A6HDF3_VIRVR|nr:ARM repeat-containing protein [Viridothelium virens]
MDASALRDRIKATLDANANTRKQAELELRHAEDQPGFPDCLLNILETEQDQGVRLSTAIYLKRRVEKGWAPAEEAPNAKPIPENERDSFRQRLVPVLASSQSAVQAQLIPTLQKILHYDFPSKWPDFLNITLQLLSSNDANSVFTGLQCLLAICKVYRYKSGDNRGDFDNIVGMTFPQLLQINQRLAGETSLEAAGMLRAGLKAYKHAVYFELPPYFRSHEAMVGWCTLFLTVVSKDPPENSLTEDLDEREQNYWWKCKKWSYMNLNRTFVRYGNPQALQKDNSEHRTFAESFINNFAPQILQTYLQQVEKWVGKTTWLSKPCLSGTLSFLDECVKPMTTWNHLKPHLETLVTHLVFPVLCQSDEDIELFETDPQEYLHRKLNFYEEVSAPDVAATNFLVSLTKSRRKETFTILNFVNQVVNRYEAAPDHEKNAREKEGALRMIGTLSSVILGKGSPVAEQVEYFFVRHVFPEFRSRHGFLRARACDTLEQFEAMKFKDNENLMTIYRNILESMADPELPVRVEAALALQPLIKHEVIRRLMQQNIPQIMQQLLKLTNEVDVDALANVMEEFVEVFAQELTPFAVALSEQLRETYLKLVRELIERNNLKEDEDDYGEFLDDKSITALGVLQTIGTLILTLESTPDVLHRLETILMPVISITLENKLYDLFNEVFEIIDSCTFAAKAISPTMWQAFELIHRTFKAGAELYLEDMLPALENFVTYGSEALVQNQAYLDAIVDMVRVIFHDQKVGGVDRICGCKLAEVIMLSLRGHVDRYIPEFIQLAMETLTDQKQKVLVKSYKVHLMEIIINAMYYNPLLAMHVLETNGYTNKFFSMWFMNIDSFTRVHDKKLNIAAISELITLRAEDVPTSVQQGWPRLLQGIVRLFQTLPAAIKNREELTKADEFQVDNEEDEDDDDLEGEVDWSTEEVEEEGDVKDEGAAYIDFLNREAQKYSLGSSSLEADEELEEESLLETPLDKVEPYQMFKHNFFRLQQEQPQLYETLTKPLNPEEQQVLQAAIHQADAIAQQQAKLAAEGQQQPQPHQTNGQQ